MKKRILFVDDEPNILQGLKRMLRNQRKEWDMAFFDRAQAFHSIEKELELCELCGASVACKDHLTWIAQKVGELSYANPTLYLSHHQQLGLIDENIFAAMSAQGRADRFKILCARCRRETTLTTKDE